MPKATNTFIEFYEAVIDNTDDIFLLGFRFQYLINIWDLKLFKVVQFIQHCGAAGCTNISLILHHDYYCHHHLFASSSAYYKINKIAAFG